jgi:hypothetical protein
MLADTPFDGQTANACLRHFSTPVIGCCLLVFPREERAVVPLAERLYEVRVFDHEEKCLESDDRGRFYRVPVLFQSVNGRV